jgi:hypothetical protein
MTSYVSACWPFERAPVSNRAIKNYIESKTHKNEIGGASNNEQIGIKLNQNQIKLNKKIW